MSVVVRQSLKGTFVNYIGVVLGIFVQFYIVAKYLDPEVIGLSKVVYEVAFLLSSLAREARACDSFLTSRMRRRAIMASSITICSFQ